MHPWQLQREAGRGLLRQLRAGPVLGLQRAVVPRLQCGPVLTAAPGRLPHVPGRTLLRRRCGQGALLAGLVRPCRPSGVRHLRPRQVHEHRDLALTLGYLPRVPRGLAVPRPRFEEPTLESRWLLTRALRTGLRLWYRCASVHTVPRWQVFRRGSDGVHHMRAGVVLPTKAFADGELLPRRSPERGRLRMPRKRTSIP